MRQYLTEHPDQLDSVAIASGEFFRNDSVKVYHGTKHSVSYATNVPEGPSSRYRIYVRLAMDSVSADSVFFEIAEKCQH